MGKQESLSDYYQFAKDLAKAERELKIECAECEKRLEQLVEKRRNNQ